MMTIRSILVACAALLLFARFAHAAHTETLQPESDGPYPVGTSTLVADTAAVNAMLAAGRDAGQYLQGDSADGELLYIDSLLTGEGSAFLFDLAVPNDATLYGGQAGATLTSAGFLLYPGDGTGDDADFFDNTLPAMHRGSGAVPFADPGERYPLLIWSHGLGDHPFSHLETLRWFASHGYVVLALFHGDLRYSATSAELLTLRPLAVSAAIDALAGNPWFGEHIDFYRIGGIGESYGGTTMLALLGGRVVLPNFVSTFDFTPVSTVTDERILSAATLVPYAGNPVAIFNCQQFGASGSGASHIQRPVLANAGTVDSQASYSMIQDLFAQLQGTRYLVSYPGEDHVFTDPALIDARNWMLLFNDAHVKGEADALARLQGAADFAGNAGENLTVAADVAPPGRRGGLRRRPAAAAMGGGG